MWLPITVDGQWSMVNVQWLTVKGVNLSLTIYYKRLKQKRLKIQEVINQCKLIPCNI